MPSPSHNVLAFYLSTSLGILGLTQITLPTTPWPSRAWESFGMLDDDNLFVSQAGPDPLHSTPICGGTGDVLHPVHPHPPAPKPLASPKLSCQAFPCTLGGATPRPQTSPNSITSRPTYFSM